MIQLCSIIILLSLFVTFAKTHHDFAIYCNCPINRHNSFFFINKHLHTLYPLSQIFHLHQTNRKLPLICFKYNNSCKMKHKVIFCIHCNNAQLIKNVCCSNKNSTDDPHLISGPRREPWAVIPRYTTKPTTTTTPKPTKPPTRPHVSYGNYPHGRRNPYHPEKPCVSPMHPSQKYPYHDKPYRHHNWKCNDKFYGKSNPRYFHNQMFYLKSQRHKFIVGCVI